MGRNSINGSSTNSVLTRRAFLAGCAAPLAAGAPADVTLQIARAEVEVAKGKVISTTAYNGSAPGPLIRMREGVPVDVEIFNHTTRLEYVHWHGFEVPAQIDGTAEERSLAVPAGGHLRYRLTPNAPGSRYVHSHAMAMNDLSAGVYSGQFAFVYVEPKHDPGRYDQEVFLSTHEWQPHFIEGDDESGTAEEIFGETDWAPSFAEIGYGIRSINGKALGHGEPLRVKEGQRVLFHILNASATENIQLYLPGHEFQVTALDGNPVPRRRMVGMLELGASERVDAIVTMNHPGVWILGSVDNDVRGSGLGMLIEYGGKKGPATYEPPAGEAWDYRIFGEDRPAPKPEETIPVVIDRIAANGMERWTINGRGFDERESKVLKMGRRYRLSLVNKTGDAHPMHLHRGSFELTSIGGVATSGLKKDVVLVKGFQTVEVDLTAHQEGLMLFHCHQQMHMDQGFKTLFKAQ